MTEEQNTIALNKARTNSDNKDKIDGFYNGYVQAIKELQEETKKFKSDYHELCRLKDMQIEEKDKQIKELVNERAELNKQFNMSKNANVSLFEDYKNLEAQIEKMRDCLKQWYEQKNQKYTDTFYESLMRDTEKYLWTDVGN